VRRVQCFLAFSDSRHQMSDNQTLLDMIEDLQIELVASRARAQHWKNVAFKLYSPFTHMQGVEMFKQAVDND